MAKVEAEVTMGLVARPGDTLIIALNRPLTMADVDRINRQVEEKLPGVKVAVFDDAAGLAVYRPQGYQVTTVTGPEATP